MTILRLCGVCLLLALYAGAVRPDFKVGFAAVTITPDETHMTCGFAEYPSGYGGGRRDPLNVNCYPISIGGYLGEKAIGQETNLDTGMLEDIYARAMVLEDEDGKTIALAILDLSGISNRIIGNITTGVDSVTGIAPENQFIGATHSHSGPDLQGLFGGVPDSYKRYVESRAIEAVRQAADSRQAAKMWVTTTDIGQDGSDNRRGWGFTDTDIALVEFRTPAGTPIGALLNFAAHPVVQQKDNLISRDYCGYVVNHLESNLSQGNQDFVAIFANGVVGDAFPRNSVELLTQKGNLAAQSYGHWIAQTAINAAAAGGSEQINPPKIVIERIYWDMSVTGPLYNLAYVLGLLDYDGRWENQQLKILTTLAYLKFGTQLQAVTFPGESLTRLGFDDGNPTCSQKAIKEAMSSNHKIFLGLTGDGLGYFIPSDEWWSGRNNYYNELVSPGREVGDQARNQLIDLVCLENGPNCPANCP